MASEPQLALGMWLAMMAAMMLPGAAPRLAHVAQRRASFILTYLGVWSAFAVAAALLQFALESSHLLTEEMAVRSGTGIALVFIGLHQLSPWKRACLRACRSAQSTPMRYSLACLASSLPLMGILFVVGVMNYFWIAIIAPWLAAEKALSWGASLAAAGGAALVAWGGLALASAS